MTVTEYIQAVRRCPRYERQTPALRMTRGGLRRAVSRETGYVVHTRNARRGLVPDAVLTDSQCHAIWAAAQGSTPERLSAILLD